MREAAVHLPVRNESIFLKSRAVLMAKEGQTAKSNAKRVSANI